MISFGVFTSTPRARDDPVFNRSHYEDVLVQRVHKWVDEDVIAKRFSAIYDFEKLLRDHNNTVILKFYLHVSPEAQMARLEERTQDPRKMWKYNEKDFAEAKLFKNTRKRMKTCLRNVTRYHGTSYRQTITGIRNISSPKR